MGGEGHDIAWNTYLPRLAVRAAAATPARTRTPEAWMPLRRCKNSMNASSTPLLWYTRPYYSRPYQVLGAGASPPP